MLRSRTMKYAAAASCVIPAVAVVIWQAYLWPDLVFLLWTAGAAAYWAGAGRNADAARLSRSVEAVQAAALRTLNHHRHDWMNDLQVLYGYIRMNKPDKTVQSVEKIRERMAHESRISKLGIASLVLFLHSFRTVTNTIQLQVRIEDDVNLKELPLDADAAAEGLMDAITACRLAAKPSAGEPALLTLELARTDRALRAKLSYTGDWNDKDELRTLLTGRLEGTPFRLAEADDAFRELHLEAELRN